MYSSKRNELDTTATRVTCTDDEVIVDIVDGRQIRTPIHYYPTLASATPEQRAAYELIGGGVCILWDELDLFFAAEDFLLGHKERVFPKFKGQRWQDPSNFVIPDDVASPDDVPAKPSKSRKKGRKKSPARTAAVPHTSSATSSASSSARSSK